MVLTRRVACISDASADRQSFIDSGPQEEGNIVRAPLRGAMKAEATSLLLARSQLYFLDRFRARVRRDTGCRLSRSGLVQILIDVFADASLDFTGITSETRLKERLHDGAGRDGKRGH
jgi:hypothetical protein